MILIAGTTPDTNCTYCLAISLQRHAASENHNFAIV